MFVYLGFNRNMKLFCKDIKKIERTYMFEHIISLSVVCQLFH